MALSYQGMVSEAFKDIRDEMADRPPPAPSTWSLILPLMLTRIHAANLFLLARGESQPLRSGSLKSAFTRA